MLIMSSLFFLVNELLCLMSWQAMVEMEIRDTQIYAIQMY